MSIKVKSEMKEKLMHNQLAKIKLDGYRCERCGHVWIPRVYSEDKDPVICPRCKSPYWNKPKAAAKK